MGYLIDDAVRETQRIYVVVADTVQNPVTFAGDQPTSMQRTEETRTIYQPAGRCATQVGHVVSKARVAIDRMNLKHQLSLPGAYKRLQRTEWYWETELEPITTITKAARDSFELHHVYQLLVKAEIAVYEFYDENPVYGPGKVRTAICTGPVDPSEVVGILDYLPLWYREDNF